MAVSDVLSLATKVGVLILVILAIVAVCYLVGVLRRVRGVLEEARGLMKDLQLRSAKLLSDAQEMVEEGEAMVKLARAKTEELVGVVDGFRKGLEGLSAGRLFSRARAGTVAALSALGEGLKTLVKKGGGRHVGHFRPRD